MFAVLAALLSPSFLLKHWKGVAAGLAVVALVTLWQIDRRGQFNAGKAQERAAALERASKMLKERMKDDATLSRMSDRDLCVELGGEWMPDDTCR